MASACSSSVRVRVRNRDRDRDRDRDRVGERLQLIGREHRAGHMEGG